ncbi:MULTISPECIES: helix-turn-helix domain-containing protein [unclassified Thalassospira]|uniref:helix-turn-helix domain-containing protein n=1 Tax=unclassified Thalassospira TaxID=2648997 RepID=UPI001B1C6FD1|nr:helix-turn-helix domain-containing protein [Thalassospira sp.]MBO6771871.1 AraC family transcriptional regulator [Thalassospira sp.]
MTGWTEYISITVAVVGLIQAVFLCLILRSEGARAFGANRWMMIFIFAIACNLIEDVIEHFVSPDVDRALELFFGPINFVIAPAIYLYFREISGKPSRRPWIHAILPMVVFNLIAWIITHDGGRTIALDGGYTVRQLIAVFCWTAIFVQISLYIALLWRVACRYFQQTQEQLGADRDLMRRWIGVILGGLTLVFVTVAIGKIVGLYLPRSTEMFGTEMAFVAVLFAMTYEIATRPALFVMADWPSDTDIDDADEGPVIIRQDRFLRSGYPDPVPASTQLSSSAPASAQGQTAQKNDDPITSPVTNPVTSPVTSPVRPLLDEEGLTRAIAQLTDIQNRGDILLDPLVSLPKLARAVGVTPNQLSYVLNHHIGQSFFDFVNAARIAEARSVLLLEPDRTILDIALSVGFNSKSTFNLAFKKITGETPSAFREAGRDNAVAPPADQSLDQLADQPAATKIAASLAQKAAVLTNPGSGPNPGNGDTAQGAVGKS